MHAYFPALALLASTLPALAASMAEIETHQLSARDPAIGTKLCTSPIVNLYAYSKSDCRTEYIQGSTGQRNSPIYFGLRFAPARPPIAGLPNLVTQKFESKCKNQPALTIDGNAAKSLAFSADGALTENCQLYVYTLSDCEGPEPVKIYNLNGQFGGGGAVGWCEAIQWRSAKVVCDKGKKNDIS